MPTPTYTPLANITLGSSAASVTFSGFSTSLYRDVILVVNPLWDGVGNTQINIRLNGDTGSNYTTIFMAGDGTSASSNIYGPQSILLTSYGFGTLKTTQPSPLIVNFLDIGATDKHKVVLGRNNSTADGVVAFASRWASTAALTSIQINCGFGSGSTFALYGVAA